MLWSSLQMWSWLHPYSSYANAPQQLASSRSTVGFITRDFHALISRQHSQTNRHGLYTLFLTSKYRCMQKISSVDALLTTQNVLSRSGRFGGGHTGWSQLQLASSVSPPWIYGAVCVQLAHFSIADWKDISIAHVIIITKSEVSTFPIIIFFRGCVPEMFVTSYSVTYCI